MRNIIKDRSRMALLILTVLVALIPLFSNNYYILYIFSTTGLYVILAMGLNVLLGYAGLVSLGQSGFYAIGAYASGILVAKTGLPFVVGLLAAVVISGLIGLIIGLSSVRLKGGYLAMVTLGFAVVVQILMINLENITGGAQGYWGIPGANLGFININTPLSWFYFIFLVVGVIAIFTYSLQKSRIGRAWMAVRDDVTAVQMMGVNPVIFRLLAFVVSAVYSGIAGSLFAHLNGSVFPDAFGVQTSILILLMVILGGIGQIMGPVIGALIVNIGFEVLRPLGDYQTLVFGCIIVLMAMFMPQGAVGLWQKVEGWLHRSPDTIRRHFPSNRI